MGAQRWTLLEVTRESVGGALACSGTESTPLSDAPAHVLLRRRARPERTGLGAPRRDPQSDPHSCQASPATGFSRARRNRLRAAVVRLLTVPRGRSIRWDISR